MAKRSRKGRNVNGILLLDKDGGLTSNDSLQQVKRLFQAAKAGHTGNLDPLATGVLPLCLGEATKISQFLLDADKRYRVSIRLGQRTTTADAEGEVISERPVPDCSRERLEAVLTEFVGEIEQVPPMYSAVKYNGTPLYKLARAGEEIERKSRTVHIHQLALIDFDASGLTVDVYCSKGTYIRTLADDIGEVLECGGHVSALRRTQSGAFTEDECVTMADLRERHEQGGLEAIDALLRPADSAVANLPEVVMPDVTASYVKQGQPVLVRHLPTEGLVRMYDQERFLGIGAILDDGRMAPRRLFQGR